MNMIPKITMMIINDVLGVIKDHPTFTLTILLSILLLQSCVLGCMILNSRYRPQPPTPVLNDYGEFSVMPIICSSFIVIKDGDEVPRGKGGGQEFIGDILTTANLRILSRRQNRAIIINNLGQVLNVTRLHSDGFLRDEDPSLSLAMEYKENHDEATIFVRNSNEYQEAESKFYIAEDGDVFNVE